MDRPILIIGGTGVFGKRLAQHLATMPDMTLFISSRSAEKAQSFVASLNSEVPNLQAQGIALDHQTNLATRLATIKPFAVIDCSGPFQGASYATAETIIKAGAHLIDLADARDYLAGYAGHLDALAKTNGVTALTGASSTPTLSTCVATHLTQGWQRIDTIDICITPGGKSEVGRSVIAAILSYAGRQIPLWKDGALTHGFGWVGARSVTIPRLGRRRAAPVETYDAEYLGRRFNVQSRVSFAAGLESRLEQCGIEAIAKLRKRRLFPDPAHLIPLLLKARKITRIPTSDQGGMLVEITGLNAKGTFTSATWSLIAKNDHGPSIPILPAAAALQKLLTDTLPSGAFFAHDHVTLADILAQMALYDITTYTDVKQAEQSGFETYLGADTFQTLPRAVQGFHTQSAPPIWTGQADITGGGIPAKILARIFGFPASGKGIPVTMRVDRTLSRTGRPIERWTRSFGETSMSSVLQHHTNGSFTEKFAPFTFTLKLAADKEGIAWPVSGWALGKIPLPFALAPQSISREFQDDQDRFRFDVRLKAPIIGQIAHYQGWLVPASGR